MYQQKEFMTETDYPNERLYVINRILDNLDLLI